MNRFILCFIFIIGLLPSCKKDSTIPVTYTGTSILVHKGGGGSPYGKYPENTLAACKEGLKYGDGIEVDIQKSRDGTLWLYHDEYFSLCDINGKGRIPAYTDEEILKHIDCMGGGYILTKFEDVLQYASENHINKLIHLDVKSWLPTQYSNGFGYLNDIADEIVRLAKKYDMEHYLIVECETAFFLDRVKKNSSYIHIYLDAFGDFENGRRKALKAGYEGISFKIGNGEPTAQQIEKLHSQGLRIQVWSPREWEEIQGFIDKKADFIITDNIDFVQ